MTAGLLVIFSSLGILIAEDIPDSNIKSAGDALWWSCTTITTVGYGDRYPVTAEGRVIAVVLMMAGVGLFGSFTALVAGYFTGTVEAESAEPHPAKEIQALQQQIASLEAVLLGMQKNAALEQLLRRQASPLP